ncbi:hypothetical protein LZ31DRAFT_258370 [Colletotrichum somersetense]|nr:hypothetical protein LZ31DRAFT_258370 [Colletotrichum somersetense]
MPHTLTHTLALTHSGPAAPGDGGDFPLTCLGPCRPSSNQAPRPTAKPKSLFFFHASESRPVRLVAGMRAGYRASGLPCSLSLSVSLPKARLGSVGRVAPTPRLIDVHLEHAALYCVSTGDGRGRRRRRRRRSRTRIEDDGAHGARDTAGKWVVGQSNKGVVGWEGRGAMWIRNASVTSEKSGLSFWETRLCGGGDLTVVPPWVTETELRLRSPAVPPLFPHFIFILFCRKEKIQKG